MRSKEFLSESKVLLEGGNMFSQATEFDQREAPKITKAVNDILSNLGVVVIPIGSGATPTPGKKSSDFDVMTDETLLMQKFNAKDGKAARKELATYLSSLGYEVAQSGTIVHLLVPVGKKHVQTDIMVAPNANSLSRFHRHALPPNSPYKGTDKIIVMSALAKLRGAMWSPYQGLFARTADGKKGELISHDIDEVAKKLIGPSATADDLGSVESIYAKLPADIKEKLNAQLQADQVWMVRRAENASK